MIETVIMDKLDFFTYESINDIFMIRNGISWYKGVVYFKIKYNTEKTVTAKSKSFSFLLKVLVYARYNRYTIRGKVIKTTSKSIVSNIFIFITDNILQNLYVEVCRILKFLVKKKLFY